MHNWSEEAIEEMRIDFRKFLYAVWLLINLPEPTRIQYDIARTLQVPPSDRFILEGFRGVAKSFITCAFSVWVLWRDPQKKVMIVSASRDRADANAVFIKKIIHLLPFLACLKAGDNQRDTQNLFDVGGATADISPSVKSVGITGQLTGTRADLLIADDVEVPNNSATQLQRDKLSEAVKEFDSIIKPGGQIIYLGTPQVEMSLYNELQKRGYECRIYPVYYPRDTKEMDFYGNKLASVIAAGYPQMAGLPTDPARFDEEDIAKRRLSYGLAGFALQFMLNTNLSDQEKYPLKLSDLIVTELDIQRSSLKWDWASGQQQRLHDIPCVGLKGDFYYAPLARSNETADYTGTVMAIDPSGRGKDETAYAIIKFLNGYLFLLEVGGYKDGYSESTLSALSHKCKYYGVNYCIYESNFGDGMFGQLLKPVMNRIHPCQIDEIKNSKQKELRIIDTLEPVMMRHKLIVNQSVIVDDYKMYETDQHYSLFYQMTRISKERNSLAHDDRLDAVCMAVAFWLEYLDRDAQAGIDEQLEDKLMEWLDPDKGVLYIEETGVKANHNSLNAYNFLKNYF